MAPSLHSVPQPTPPEQGPFEIAISPNGSYLYVTNYGSNTLSAYSIGPSGALTAITSGTITTGAGPFGIAFSPNGSYLYVANFIGSSLSAYSISTGGVLTALNIATYTTGTNPAGIAICPVAK